MIKVQQCKSATDYSLATGLTRDYLDWLDLDLGYQGVARELHDFSTMYSPPNGLFLIAFNKSDLAGGVGLRTIGPGICEMKRLYVYDHYKGQGIGRILCEQLIDQGKSMGFQSMRLDTLARMQSAISLYGDLGFIEIAPYCFNPDPTAIYMERNL